MYFDLNARSRAGRRGGAVPDSVPVGGDMPWWEQGLMYVFIVLGILFAPLIDNVGSGTALPAEFISVPLLITAGVVGFVVIPAIWEKVGAKQDAPLIVRLAVFFQNGVFWQALLGTIAAAAT